MSEDIEALQTQLMKAREDDGWFITGDQAKDFSRALTALVAERDEARREWCYMESCTRCNYAIEPSDERSIAAERGWDCFAQEGGGA